MINDDPSNISTIRRLLDELKTNYLDKFNMKKLIIAADGKIFHLLIQLINGFGSEYSWVLPYLGNIYFKNFLTKVSNKGEFHFINAHLKNLYKKYAGFFLEAVAKKCGYRGASLTNLLRVKDYR